MSDNNDSDANFNDAELQDIMSEIESLEKEFVDDDDNESESEDLINELENDETETAEVEGVQASASSDDGTEDTPESDETVDDIVSEADIESITQDMVTTQKQEEAETSSDNVTELQIVKDSTATNSTSSPGSMSFQGSGNLDLNLTFFIGSEQATLKVTDGEGLTVDMAGTTLRFDSTGCHVDIEGGANINLPLNSSNTAKKAA
jgi:hypothetical protein